MPDPKAMAAGETALRAIERDWNAAARNWNTAHLSKPGNR